MEKKVTTSVTTGLIISLVLIILGIIGYITGMDQQTWYRWVSIIVFIGGIIYACTNFGKQSEDKVKFGDIFAFGFKTSAVVTCIMIIFTIVFVLVFPDIKEKAMETARKQMEEKQQLSEEQIESGLSIARKSFMVFLVLGSVFLYLAVGAISAVIGAAITKKAPESPFQNQA
jgi:TRAP-type mannitol/chloroaromatic compound transport system permease large subunit